MLKMQIPSNILKPSIKRETLWYDRRENKRQFRIHLSSDNVAFTARLSKVAIFNESLPIRVSTFSIVSSLSCTTDSGDIKNIFFVIIDAFLFLIFFRQNLFIVSASLIIPDASRCSHTSEVTRKESCRIYSLQMFRVRCCFDAQPKERSHAKCVTSPGREE